MFHRSMCHMLYPRYVFNADSHLRFDSTNWKSLAIPHINQQCMRMQIFLFKFRCKIELIPKNQNRYHQTVALISFFHSPCRTKNSKAAEKKNYSCDNFLAVLVMSFMHESVGVLRCGCEESCALFFFTLILSYTQTDRRIPLKILFKNVTLR